LALEATDVQSVLVQSRERDLLGDTQYISKLLKTLLDSAGPTYIIIDGLDEMQDVERRILLEHLLNLKDCPKTKILLCSRPEDDIAKILESRATGISIEKQNSGSIQSYVNQRVRNWIRDGGFDQEGEKQIRLLLAPLAANAKGNLIPPPIIQALIRSNNTHRFANRMNQGMFLYARIILDSAEQFTEPEEIERELKVLPQDLNEA
jgi:hypothetical protein